MLARLTIILLAVSWLALPSASAQQPANYAAGQAPVTRLRAVPAESVQRASNRISHAQAIHRPLRQQTRRVRPAPPQARRIQHVSHQTTTAAPPTTAVPPAAPNVADTETTSKEEKPAEASEPFLVFTKEDEAGTEINTTASPSDADLMIRFATWTVILLCCCLLTVLGIRRWQRSRGILPATDTKSRVLETVSLGPGRSVSLVQLADVRAVIGCDSTGVSSIVLAQPSFEEALRDSEDDKTEGFDLNSDRAA